MLTCCLLVNLISFRGSICVSQVRGVAVESQILVRVTVNYSIGIEE